MPPPCKQGEPLVQQALHGTLTEAEQLRLAHHTAVCPHCAAALREGQAVLDLMATRVRPEPPPAFWDGYHDRLLARMARPSAGARLYTTLWAHLRTVLSPVPRPAWQLAFALGLVALGIWLGRTRFPAPEAPPPVAQQQPSPAFPDPLTAAESPQATGPEVPAVTRIPLPETAPSSRTRPARNRPPAALPRQMPPALLPASVETRTWQYLDRSKVLLLGIVNADSAQADPALLNLPRKQALARDLVSEAAQLQTELNSPEQQRLQALVRDLEVILLQIANLEAHHDLPAIEMVRNGVERRGLLFKINLEAMQRTAPATSSPNPGT